MARVLQVDARAKILEAAEKHLWHYGFKKTTIDEIAADAGVGKGTVYLYFESKEDIALAIIAQYKLSSLEKIQDIARDSSKEPSEKLREILSSPILMAHERCSKSPAAQEMVIAVRPHIQVRMRPYLEQEIAIIAEVLEEGNRQGIYAVDDTMRIARTLKYATLGFLPPYPCVPTPEEMELELGLIINLFIRGIRK
jgi:AcrR family transcriptional regulator